MHPAPAGGCLIHDPVVELDGFLYLAIGGRNQPILFGGAPIRSFNPGWRARALYTGFAPLFLLELEHEDGERGTWFLGHRMERVGGAVGQLPPDLKALLRQRCLLVLGRLVDAVLNQCDPALDPAADGFLDVCATTRHEIAAWCVAALIPEACMFLAADLSPHSLLFRGETGALAAIDRVHVLDGLQVDWPGRTVEFLRNGRIDWPSPVDGRILFAQGGLFIDDIHFAYRFADRRHGLVFYVLVADHHSVVAGLWFPSMGLIVSPDESRKDLTYGMLRHLPWWVLCHALDHARALLPALVRGATGFASVLRSHGLHIGHQLWNELSGIDRMLRVRSDPVPGHLMPDHLIPDWAMPDWIVLDAARGTELFGPIDVLFPELEGRVNRSLRTIAEMSDYAYRSDLFILRITWDVVTAGLRTRIQGVALRSDTGRRAKAAARRLARNGAPVVLFGLRVENRTLVEMKPFLDRFVAFVAARHPGAVIVFDAHNASVGTAVETAAGKAGGVIRSHGEREGGRQPIEVERDLVEAVRTEARRLDVTIVDTIGQTIASSIGWCNASDCFVSIWGASLAKYRWVCNRPGFVMTSRANLLGRPDLHIYDAPRYIEDPAPMHFVSPAAVTDDAGATPLLPMPGQPLFFNFDVDEDQVLPAIAELLKTSLAARPVAARRTGRKLPEPV